MNESLDKLHSFQKQPEALRLARSCIEAWERGCDPDLYGPDIDEALAAIEDGLAQHQPQDWSVYNTGAEVASGLTFDEAWDYLTPARLARGWCAVCVVDASNLPVAHDIKDQTGGAV
jgi:hypothetical protein